MSNFTMSRPDYIAPSSLEEALEILGDRTRITQVLAGGTDLIPRIHTGELQPQLLVDIRLLPIHSIRLKGNYLLLGAGVTIGQILEDDLVAHYFPALLKACSEIGGPAIRNLCTLGGNLAASKPEANTLPALLVYDAQLCTATIKTSRVTPLIDFYKNSGESDLEPGELIEAILIPLPPRSTAAQFLKFGYRRGMADAIVNVAIRISLDQKKNIQTARIALGAYAQAPFRAYEAENNLAGCKLGEVNVDRIARLVVETYMPRDDLFSGANYRKKVAMVLVGRALREACTGLLGTESHG